MIKDVSDNRLDDIFHALANRTRRALLARLAEHPARVSELAKPHRMSVNAISKHLFVLERAGLIKRTRKAGVQSCVLDADPMASAEKWILSYRQFWSEQLDRFVGFVEKNS